MADFPLFDADTHYYEAPDAFIRHVDRKMQKRAMQWATIGGRERLLVGGKVNKFIPNPTFDPVTKPGSLSDYFRAKEGVSDLRAAFGELEPLASHPEYTNRDARLTVMDGQGVEASILMPTLGMGMEIALKHDPEATLAAFRGFNRWLEDDWGFSYKERIYAVPYITLSDVDWALEELEYALENNARLVMLRVGPVYTPTGPTTPGNRRHDRFFERLEESGIGLVLHGGDYGYQPYYQLWGLEEGMESFQMPVVRRLLSASPISDMVASLIGDDLFGRFPNLRVATIETGSGWVEPLLNKMRGLAVQQPTAFSSDPCEQLLQKVWVTPFFEDNVLALVDLVGADHVLFGSDFPHAEGLPEPAAFEKEIDGLDPVSVKKVMYENARALVTPRRG